MATQDAAGGPDRPAAARYWRLEATEFTPSGIWDLDFVDFLTDGARIVRYLASGDAGQGYEADNAFRPGSGWWGGRPAPDPDGTLRCFIGAVFDRAIVPTAITLVPAPGPHRAAGVKVQSSLDGVTWQTRSEVELPRRRDTDRAAHTVFYAPTRAGSATSWRLRALSTTHRFAWDVVGIGFLRGGQEVPGTLVGSGDAGAGFGLEHLGEPGGFWGGRPDQDGSLHLTLSSTAHAELEIDRIVLEQGTDHWASAAVLERLSQDEGWSVWRHLGGLRPGRNDVLLEAQPHRPRPAPAGLSVSSTAQHDTFDDRRILVLIASYRDPELAGTVADALAQAAYPEHVRFAICHQVDEATRNQLDRWDHDPRFRVDVVDHTESRGCCWARNRTFALYDDEPYILQIDSHMRFAARWDVRCIEMLEATGAQLPVLTSYPPRYTVRDDGTVEYDTISGPQRLYVDEVFADLTTRQKTSPLIDLSRPEPSPTLAAGQLFARGRFCRDVEYDPDIYFSGEEISLAARAYTHGYDLFAPNENLVWHLYQHEQPKHWEDHDDHSERHRVATRRLHTLFRGDHTTLGRFGLGSQRTLAEFEDHAAVDLGALRVPVEGVVTVRIDRSVIPPRDDYEAFIVVFLDRLGKEVDRRQVRAPDVLDLSRASVTFADIDASASQTIVLPLTRFGLVGEVALAELGGRRPEGRDE